MQMIVSNGVPEVYLNGELFATNTSMHHQPTGKAGLITFNGGSDSNDRLHFKNLSIQ
jgi:hypothetical protein